jgi:tetratricopeptide (TPR) repeat protein
MKTLRLIPFLFAVILSPIAPASGLDDPNNSSDSLRAVIEVLMEDGIRLAETRLIDSVNISIEHFESALELATSRFGAADTGVASADLWLGICHFHLADYTKSKKYVHEAMEAWRNSLGQNHPVIARTLRYIAMANVREGNFAHAEQLYLQAISHLESADDLPEFYLDVLGKNLNSLGLLYHRQSRYNEATNSYRRAQKIWVDILGAENRWVGVTYVNLGANYSAQGKYSEAEENLLKGLLIAEKELVREKIGIDLVSTTLTELGKLYILQNRFDEASDILRRSLKVREEAFGLKHQKVIEPLEAFAQIDYIKGNLSGAKDKYERSININAEIYGKDNFFSLNALDYLAVIGHRRGAKNESLDYFTRGVTLRKDFVVNAFSYASEELKLQKRNLYFVQMMKK